MTPQHTQYHTPSSKIKAVAKPNFIPEALREERWVSLGIFETMDVQTQRRFSLRGYRMEGVRLNQPTRYKSRF